MTELTTVTTTTTTTTTTVRNQRAGIEDRWKKKVKIDGKMVTVDSNLKGKVKRWRVRWVDENGTEHTKSFDLKPDAQAHLNKVTTNIHKGESTDPSRGNDLFGPVAEAWYKTKGHRKPSTLGGYRSVMDLIVLPRWKDTPLKKITYEEYRVWLGEIAQTGSQKGGPLSAGRVIHAHQLMGAVLKYAVKTGRLTKNVALEIDRDEDLPDTPEKERRYLTHEQLLKLARNAGRFQTAVLVLGYCGLRFGELAALRRRHVGNQELGIYASVSRVPKGVIPGDVEAPAGKPGIWETTPESKRARFVPVPKPVWDRLEKELPDDPDAFLFPSYRGGILPIEEFRRTFNAARKAAGLPDDLTPHGLRHTTASLAISAGANVKVVQRILGHASAAMTLDLYGHLMTDDLTAAAAALGAAMEAAVAELGYDDLDVQAS